jgi:alpha-L-fucosidase
MRKFILTIAAALAMTGVAAAQTTEIPAADTRWFEEARFGMFVHFGPYSVLGAGEWIMYSRPIERNEYLRLQDFFNPQAFDAKAWVKTAKDAGMKYIIITSRHHDSFSNWDTKQTEWNIMNTPYGKDILRQLADECRAQGMKLGFYYSLLDWMREDYQWETGRRSKSLGRTEGTSDWEHYIEFMKAQITELLTGYGDIAVMWFDGHWDQTANGTENDQNTVVDWHYPEIYGLIRRLQPNCLIANNHHTNPIAGESYQVFERDVPGENTAGYSGGVSIAKMPLETCQTINNTWGFNIIDNKYKSTTELLHLLVRTAGTGANLLLNVGPMPDGRIQSECTERLQTMGQWLGKWGHTIYGTRAGWIKPQPWGAVTLSGKTAYIHVLDGKAAEGGKITIEIPGFRSAKWLNVDGKLAYARSKGSVTFTLPEGLDPVDSIIEVVTK